MKCLTRTDVLMIIGSLVVIGIMGCADDSSTVTPPPPPTDSDSGIDTGTATDTGTDEIWDTTPLPGINLMPNEEGFMKTEDNELGIQGAWYTFGCNGAVIDPPEKSTFTNPGRMCISGTAPQVVDLDSDGELEYSTIWGAGMGFDLCGQSEEEAAADTAADTDTDTGPGRSILSQCPYNADLATQLIGISVRFSGYVNAAELRILFNEGDSVANSYYRVAPDDVAASTVIDVKFKDDEVKTWYNPDLKPNNTNPDYMYAIQFQIPTNDGGPVDWDFCVDAISAITAE
jgi:hypothetical protein